MKTKFSSSGFCRKNSIIRRKDIIKEGKEGFSFPELSIVFIKLEVCVHCSCIRTSKIRRNEGVLIYTYFGDNGKRSFLQGSE